jgi:hypothetical protein
MKGHAICYWLFAIGYCIELLVIGYWGDTTLRFGSAGPGLLPLN